MLFLEYERDWGPEQEYKASHFTGRTLLTGETAGLIKGLCFCLSLRLTGQHGAVFLSVNTGQHLVLWET